MKSYYPIPVAGKKWWSRIFYDLIDRTIYNSFVLEQESTHHAKRSQKLFRIDLAKQLIDNFSSRRKRGRPSDEHFLARHIERHFPDFLPTNAKGKRLERRCKVCYDGGKVKRTSYYCPDCDVGLCAGHRKCFCVYTSFFCTLHWSFLTACQLFGFAGLRDMSRCLTKCYVLRV